MGSRERFSEIFEAVIQDHSSRARNFGKIESPDAEAEGLNPLTGDRLTVQLSLDEDKKRLERVLFSGSGSSLALASASIMTGELTGDSPKIAIGKAKLFLGWLEGEPINRDDAPREEKELWVLLEIRNFPHRTRCAGLAWKTGLAALEKLEKK